MADAVRELRDRIKSLDKKLSPEDNPGADGAVYVETMRGLMLEAEALGDPSLVLHARLTYSYALKSKPAPSEREPVRRVYREILAVLRRCLLMWDELPELRDDDNVDALWQQLLNCANTFIRLFTEPFDLIVGLLDEVERRCPPHWNDTRFAIVSNRIELHARRGDVAEAERLYRELRTRPAPKKHMFLDGMHAIDCTMWQRLGRDDLALEAIAPVLNGQIPVRDGSVYTDTPLMAYLRTGRTAEAVEAHQSTYALPGKKMEEIAAHLEFCARTGNIERGLDVLHRHLGSISGHETYEHMLTRAAAALLCRRVCELDLDREWFWECSCDGHEPEHCDYTVTWTYARLGADLRWKAVDYIREVAEGDGSDFATVRLHDLLTAAPIADGLELPPDTAEARRPEPSASKHLTARTPEELRAATAEALGLTHGNARENTLFAVVQNAVAAGDPEAVLDARLAAVETLTESPGWRVLLFPQVDALARALNAHPEHFGAKRADGLWNAVPIVLDQVLTGAAVHMNQVGGLIRRLLPHARPGTDDLHHLRWYGTELAARRGDLAAARDAWAAYAALPARDVHNAPEDLRRRVVWWLDLGLDDEAETAAAGADCEDLLLMPYLRSGRDDLARDVHERTWREASTLAGVAAHMEYCARTGSLDRGKEIIQRNLALWKFGWNDFDLRFDQIRCDAALDVLCAEIIAAGADETWTWTCDCCEPSEWTYAKLGEDISTFRHRWEELTGTRFHSGRRDTIAARDTAVHRGA